MSSSYGFELGCLVGFSILMYNLYVKFGNFYVDDFLLDLKQRLGYISESFTIIFLVVMIYVAFSLNYMYATASLTLALILRYFKDSQKNPLRKYFETLRYNSAVREYHRPRVFPVLYHILNIGTLTLILGLFYPVIAKLLFNKTVIISFFLKSWYCLFAFITFLNLFYNLYIVWFANLATKAAGSESGSLILKSGLGLAMLGTALEEIGITEPTSITKVPRKAMGAQVFETNAQKEYYRALQSHLPIDARDKCFAAVGVYVPQDSSSYLPPLNKLIEKRCDGNLSNFPSSDAGDVPGGFKPLTYYDAYDPVLARALADEHREVIEKTAGRANMEILYPEIVEEPHSKHLIEHEHDVQLRPVRFPKKKF